MYFSIGVLVMAARQKRAGQINSRLAGFIYWTPRISGVLITLFVALFALDMFSARHAATVPEAFQIWRTKKRPLPHLRERRR